MEWVFDADRRVEMQLGNPIAGMKISTTDILYIIVELQVHEGEDIIRAKLPISYYSFSEVKDPDFMLYIVVQMGIDMCLDLALEKGELNA